jgi:hypothetical protein
MYKSRILNPFVDENKAEMFRQLSDQIRRKGWDAYLYGNLEYKDPSYGMETIDALLEIKRTLFMFKLVHRTERYIKIRVLDEYWDYNGQLHSGEFSNIKRQRYWLKDNLKKDVYAVLVYDKPGKISIVHSSDWSKRWFRVSFNQDYLSFVESNLSKKLVLTSFPSSIVDDFFFLEKYRPTSDNDLPLVKFILKIQEFFQKVKNTFKR